MKKLKVFLLAFVMVLCGTIVLSACGKEEEEPEKPIVAVESTVNPTLCSGNEYVENTVIGFITITTSAGDTPGVIKWESATQRILLGENEYTWVFTPEDTERYKVATGTLTITGIEDYELTAQIDDWVYGQTPNEPIILGYTGLSENISITYEYYNMSGTLLSEKPTEAGEYKLCATVTIVGLANPINIWVDSFKILKANISDFGLTIEDWTFDQTPNVPEVKDELKGIVKFLYSTEENGTYTEILPMNAGTYYVKAEIVSDNLTGTSLPIQFVVEKASYDELININIEGWTFGEDPKNVSITSVNNIIDIDELSIVSYYAEKETENFVSTVPTDAGEYTLKVVIGDSTDGNYKETIFTKDFVISKAKLTSMTYQEEINVDYGTLLSNITLIEGWAWDETDINYDNPLQIGENSRVAIYTIKNYEPIKVNLTINVNYNSNVSSVEELKTALSYNLETINVINDINITSNLEISSETNIVIASEKTLTVTESVVLTISDQVTISGDGSFVNNGSVIFSATSFEKINNLPNYVNEFSLKDDVTNDTIQDLTITSSIKINLNNKTLTNVKFIIKNAVTIKSGSIKNTGDGIEINSETTGDIVLDNISVEATGYALITKDATQNCNVYLQAGCEFVSTDNVAVMLTDGHNYYFENSALTGKNGLNILIGNVTLVSCAITGNGPIELDPTEDSVITGHAIFINAKDGCDVELSVSGGSLTVSEGDYEHVIYAYLLEDAECSITIEVEVDGVAEENIGTNNSEIIVSVAK